tara:strand:+ start:118 stop:1011 length:894 start_codon:yes stop_codon:yes gene_type:complete
MKRKLVQQGTSTLMISLPSKWIKNNHLKKGNEINLDLKDNLLLVTPDIKQKKREITIRLTSITESSIRTLITNAYRLGYDIIKINFKNEHQFKIIKNTVKNNLIGFEITKKSKDNCEIENITEPSKDQFDNIFLKVLLNIEELFNITEDLLNSKKIYEDVNEIETNIQQFDNFCRRVISKNGINNPTIWTFHHKLIHAQRDLYLLIKYLLNNKTKPDKDTINLLKNCKEIYLLLKESYLKKEIKNIEKIHDIEKIFIYKKGYSLLKNSKNNIIIHHLLSSIRNFYLASSPLTGNLFN